MIQSGRQSCKYHYADTRLVEGCRPPRAFNLPDVQVVFDLSQQEISDLLEPRLFFNCGIAFSSEDGKVKISAFDKDKLNSTNRYDISDTERYGSKLFFQYLHQIRKLEVASGDYQISLCDKLAIQLQHADIDAGYVIA